MELLRSPALPGLRTIVVLPPRIWARTVLSTSWSAARGSGCGEPAGADVTQCTGPVRETAGELVYDGAGGLTGTLTVSDPDLETPIGAFAITGVHNPSNGGITLVPGLWIDDQGTSFAFYIDGTFDPMTDSFDGDQRTNIAACPTGTWKATIQ